MRAELVLEMAPGSGYMTVEVVVLVEVGADYDYMTAGVGAAVFVVAGYGDMDCHSRVVLGLLGVVNVALGGVASHYLQTPTFQCCKQGARAHRDEEDGDNMEEVEHQGVEERREVVRHHVEVEEVEEAEARDGLAAHSHSKKSIPSLGCCNKGFEEHFVGDVVLAVVVFFGFQLVVR
jgi:hypothetical protein